MCFFLQTQFINREILYWWNYKDLSHFVVEICNAFGTCTDSSLSLPTTRLRCPKVAQVAIKFSGKLWHPDFPSYRGYMQSCEQLTLVSSVLQSPCECSHHLYEIMRDLLASLVQSVQTFAAPVDEETAQSQRQAATVVSINTSLNFSHYRCE